MSIESMIAAQACRSYLGISTEVVSTVIGYVKGAEHTVTITMDHNKVEFGFDKPIGNYQFFNTDWQDMDWDEENKLLTISNEKPKYSFNILFPEQ